jgi:hypothetical protein
MSQADLENSARHPDLSEVDGDDVALNVMGPDSERPKSRKFKYFLIFLLFQLSYTYILFVVFFSPKPAGGLTQPQTATTTDPTTPTLPSTGKDTDTNPATEPPIITLTDPGTTPTNTTDPVVTPPVTNHTDPVINPPVTNPTDPVVNPPVTNPTDPGTTDPSTPTTPTEPTTPPAPVSVLNFTKVASIIETREDSRLVPLILHFASVVGDDWPFKIIHSKANKHFFENSVAIQKHVKSGRFELIELPEGTHFGSRPDVTSFLTKRWVWDQLAPAVHVLLFQLDSMICANADKTVDEYIQYDWIGAPWNTNGGGNGGLSIRNRLKILQVIEKWSNNPYFEAEDVYYWTHLKELPNPVMPTFEESNKFSVELVWNDKPLGYHQPYRYWQKKINEIEAYCPEIKLTLQNYV